MTDPRVPRSIDFLSAVAGFARSAGGVTSSDKPIRLAVIDPAYDPLVNVPNAAPAARVTFEGESTLSGKAYPVRDGFLPTAGQRVYLLPIGNTYLIAGSVGGQAAQGFWQDALGAGVEFGGGSYFDTDAGWVLGHDVSILGDFTVDGRFQGKGMVMATQSPANSANYAGLTTVATLPAVTLEAGRAYEFRHGNGVQHTATGIVHVQVHCTEMAAYVVDWGRYPITLATTVMICAGRGGYVRNATAGNLTRTFTLHMGASAGTGFHAGGTNRRRYFEIWDVGRAVDFVQGMDIT